MWEVVDCKKVMKRDMDKELQMTREEEIDFLMSKKCHICNEDYKLTLAD